MTRRTKTGARWWLAWTLGGACLGLVLGPAAAGQAGPVSNQAVEEIGSFSVRADASGMQILLGDQVSGTAPDAATTLETGGIGYGRASVAWPGALGANAGDLVILASAGQIPPEMEPTFRLLNYPVRAEARAPGGPEEESFADGPGVTMRSSATAASVEAVAEAERTTVPGLGGYGAAHVTSSSTHAQSVGSEATSTVSDVVIGDGVITIDSVTSIASATSDGAEGSGDASTVVSGVRVAGQPATIDEDGLRLGDGESTPLSDVANELAAQTLREAQIEIVVTEPVVEVQGPTATATAGSLLIAVGEDGVAMLLGGAHASARANPLFDVPAFEPPAIEPDPAPAVAEVADPPAPAAPGPASTAGPSAAPSAPPPQPEPSSTAALVDLPADPIAFFGHATPAWLALLGAAAGALTARALRTAGLGLTSTATPCTAEGSL